MATISIDVGELADRLGGLPDWTRPGDEIVVTRCGLPVYRLVPAATPPAATTTPAPSPWVPYTVRHPAPPRTTPRPLGTHPGHTTLAPDFNDPCDWDGSPLPKDAP